LMPESGLFGMIPELTACTMTSFKRWHSRLTVSKLPLVAIGRMVSIVFTAVIL